MAPGLFRRKPFTVEAMRFDGPSNGDVIADWVNGRYYPESASVGPHVEWLDDGTVIAAFEGDWVVHGIHGGFYAVPAEHFLTGYAPISPCSCGEDL